MTRLSSLHGWLMALASILVVLSLFAVARNGIAGSRDEEHEHEAVVYRGSTKCGVERWHVKTGLDADARKVNLSRVTNTNIIHLRSLPAPSSLPSNTRIKPTETTVFRVSAFLLRFKQETDSDYHLVLSDSGGRTMIAEIPAPDCVGTSSPFLSRITTARSQFDQRYHVTKFWQRVRAAVTVAGVGFFDFKHGQSGVAPNAIELHPVLAISFGKGAPPAPTEVALPNPPLPAPGKTFVVTAWVSPRTMSHNAYPTLYARTAPGASCTASVVYSTGRSLASLDGSTRKVGSSGVVSWRWHEETSGNGGTATVTCSYRGQTRTATALFTVG